MIVQPEERSSKSSYDVYSSLFSCFRAMLTASWAATCAIEPLFLLLLYIVGQSLRVLLERFLCACHGLGAFRMLLVKHTREAIMKDTFVKEDALL